MRQPKRVKLRIFLFSVLFFALGILATLGVLLLLAAKDKRELHERRAAKEQLLDRKLLFETHEWTLELLERDYHREANARLHGS